ncbi:MAG TPA: long-chain fatty acid--CoA ligase [Nitrospirota bacterium]|nr:long-chain fatty acid--CoA ligase [Nitrospirota bacterium]
MIKEMLPLDQLLRKRASLTPRTTFVKFSGKKFSYRAMDRLADSFASFMHEKGIKPGDRVAILCHNCAFYIAAYFGIIRSGAVVLPLNNLLTHEELDYILQDAGAVLCLYDLDCRGTVEKLSRNGGRSFVMLSDIAASPAAVAGDLPDPAHTVDDISTILYTSGTTGRPKGALLTHRNIITNASAATEVIHVTHQDRFIVFLPLFHSFTYTVCVILPLLAGAMISVLPGVRPFSRVVKSLILDRITLFVAIPTVYKILAEKDMPWFVKVLLNLRLCVSGAAPLPVRVIREFEAAFKVPLLEGYGLTEASPVVSINPPERGRNKPGTVGLPLPGIAVKVVDDAGKELPLHTPGELAVKGPNVMRGYLNRPGDTVQTIKDGWLYTGDIASLDEDGYIRIIDRKKDMIIVDGLNVYPYEVEEVMYRNPAVRDCAMIGVPHEHEEGKELPIMYVVQKDGQATTPKAFREYLSHHVAHYKIPRRFIMVQELPRTATGKILKRDIRKLYLETETQAKRSGT